MSNDIMIIRTVFEDVADGSRTPGVRVCDEHGQSYIMWDFTPDDDLDLFFKVRDHADDVITNILDFMFEHGKPVYIDQNLVTCEQIQREMMKDYEPPSVQ